MGHAQKRCASHLSCSLTWNNFITLVQSCSKITKAHCFLSLLGTHWKAVLSEIHIKSSSIKLLGLYFDRELTLSFTVFKTLHGFKTTSGIWYSHTLISLTSQPRKINTPQHTKEKMPLLDSWSVPVTGTTDRFVLVSLATGTGAEGTMKSRGMCSLWEPHCRTLLLLLSSALLWAGMDIGVGSGCARTRSCDKSVLAGDWHPHGPLVSLLSCQTWAPRKVLATLL